MSRSAVREQGIARVRETNINSWWTLAIDTPVKGPLGCHFEAPVRRSAFLDTWYRLQFHPAATKILLHVSPNHGPSIFDQNRSFAGVARKLNREKQDRGCIYGPIQIPARLRWLSWITLCGCSFRWRSTCLKHAESPQVQRPTNYVSVSLHAVVFIQP
jgi:hypothetical protein